MQVAIVLDGDDKVKELTKALSDGYVVKHVHGRIIILEKVEVKKNDRLKEVVRELDNTYMTLGDYSYSYKLGFMNCIVEMKRLLSVDNS